MKKVNSPLIGFLQALGLVVYCGLIVGLFQLLGANVATPPQFFGSLVILAIFVFSAAVCGSIVFGYAAYLGLKGKIKQALSVLGYTLLFSFLIILVILILILVL